MRGENGTHVESAAHEWSDSDVILLLAVQIMGAIGLVGVAVAMVFDGQPYIAAILVVSPVYVWLGHTSGIFPKLAEEVRARV